MNDQDYEQMYRMNILQNIYGAVSCLNSLKGHQIHNLPDSDRRILAYLREEKIRIT